ADPETLVVVTGQQPGLFGGRLYALSKAVAAARWAAELEAAGRPAVAVFWVATEDHDFAEVAHGTFLTHEGLLDVGLGDDPDPLLPVGMRSFGPAVEACLEQLREAIPGDRFGAWTETLGRWYRPAARFGEAFPRLLVHLLGERAPLMLDAQLPALKRAEVPWMERLVRERHALDQALTASEDRIRSYGFDLQVAPQPGVSPLFLLRGGERRRIEWIGESHYRLRGLDEERPVDELYDVLRDNPGVLSPGVLARPALQDAVLGSALQVLGPGELSYMVQAAAVHGFLGLDGPATSLRPQTLVLEERHLEWIEDLGLGLEDLLGDRRELDQRLAEAAGVDFVTPVKEQIATLLDGLRGPVTEVDANLAKPLERTRDHAIGALEQLAAKLAAAAARTDEVRRRRVDTLRELCLPHGSLQERVLSTSYFPGKYGETLVEALWRQMELDGRHLQVIRL
ncbi:MAG: bacillithiol biosynthesis cysteine-adding enzyme BshC, partial [Acidobacteria bacterium]|nr:bacillithiol biosynthesis cysteine-adding enzyme BshC [Acidobacteriota bacterium]